MKDRKDELLLRLYDIKLSIVTILEIEDILPLDFVDLYNKTVREIMELNK